VILPGARAPKDRESPQTWFLHFKVWSPEKGLNLQGGGGHFYFNFEGTTLKMVSF